MERDWFDWASLVFNTLATSAGVVGLFVAVRAYRLARRQGRATFEVQMLHELMLMTRDETISDHIGDSPVMAYRKHGIQARLEVLPKSELPTWWHIADCVSLPVLETFIVGFPYFGEEPRGGTASTYEKNVALNQLRSEVIKALERRMG
ncbi:hypothetical protein [Micromonospora sp. CA-246542]|uniref:hypothetical protein n=1 Tax=Micromonospora sp. CA-246542 TaxID=3239959 RepID=UPI003D8DD37F